MRSRVFSRFAEPIAAATARALYAEGNSIINDSEPLVPVETGTLKASKRVMEPEYKGDHIVVRAGYGYGGEYEDVAQTTDPGGPGYAVYVHERLDVHHDPPTSAKFLERPALEHKKTFPGRIAVEIRTVLRSRKVA